MPIKTRAALLAIAGAVAYAIAAALLPDTTAQGGQFQPAALLTAQAETTEQDGMMAQGDMGRVRDRLELRGRRLSDGPHAPSLLRRD